MSTTEEAPAPAEESMDQAPTEQAVDAAAEVASTPAAEAVTDAEEVAAETEGPDVSGGSGEGGSSIEKQDGSETGDNGSREDEARQSKPADTASSSATLATTSTSELAPGRKLEELRRQESGVSQASAADAAKAVLTGEIAAMVELPPSPTNDVIETVLNEPETKPRQPMSTKKPLNLVIARPLSDQALAVLVANLVDVPVLHRLVEHPDLLARAVRIMPIATVPLLDQVVPLIDDEAYWMRSATSTWQNCQVAHHGGSWKRLFLELLADKKLQETCDHDSWAEAQHILTLGKQWIRTLRLQQLVYKLDLPVVFEQCARLETFTAAFGARGLGMSFDWSQMGAKPEHIRSLSDAVRRSGTLMRLVVNSSLLDDEMTRVICGGLLHCPNLQHLELAHNKIGDRGARAVAKLMSSDSKLRSVSLVDNRIGESGAKALARGIAAATSLQSFSIRLNRVGDDGGRMLIEGLASNPAVTDVNLSSNGLGIASATELADYVRTTTTLMALDVSGNMFAEAGGELIDEALSINTSLCKLDIRLNRMAPELEGGIAGVMRTRNATRVSRPGFLPGVSTA